MEVEGGAWTGGKDAGGTNGVKGERSVGWVAMEGWCQWYRRERKGTVGTFRGG